MDIRLCTEAREAAKKLGSWKIFLAKQFGKKIYLCHGGPEKHEHWTGQLPFYLFWCHQCEHWAKNYPNGFPEKQRLHCSSCDARYSFVQLKTQLAIMRDLFRMVRSIRALKKEHRKNT